MDIANNEVVSKIAKVYKIVMDGHTTHHLDYAIALRWRAEEAFD